MCLRVCVCSERALRCQDAPCSVARSLLTWRRQLLGIPGNSLPRSSLIFALCPSCCVLCAAAVDWQIFQLFFHFVNEMCVCQALPPKISVDLAKTFINLIPRKCMHTHTNTHTHTHAEIQSKMRALFMATEIFYSRSEIVKRLTYIWPVCQGNGK